MEEVKNESQQEKRIETDSEKTLSNESMVGIDVGQEYFHILSSKVIDTEHIYVEASEEEKVEHCAAQMVLKVISNSSKPLSSDEQSLLFERTVRQVKSERQTLFNALLEAEEELKTLRWNSILPRGLTQVNQVRVGNRIVTSQRSAQGFRGLFIITFGNFVLTNNDSWVYRPTKDQMISLVRRFLKKKACERHANQLRDELRLSPLERAKMQPPFDENLVESEAMKSFKEQILESIKQLRLTV